MYFYLPNITDPTDTEAKCTPPGTTFCFWVLFNFIFQCSSLTFSMHVAAVNIAASYFLLLGG
jgi:hypothetical protein